MAAGAEIAKEYARAYVRADKPIKGLILDQVVVVAGWSTANARRRLATAKTTGLARRRPGPAPGFHHYSYDALTVLQAVWAVSGGMCGKYLAASMGSLLDNVEAHGCLVDGQARFTLAVRAELEAMAPATIDRYLRPTKARTPLRGKTTTKPGSMLRNSITIRRAGDEVETEPGFLEVDTVAYCGPTLVGGVRAHSEHD
jgi:hypothetical protein